MKTPTKSRTMTPTRSTQESFGLHVMIDAYDCDPEALNDPKRLYHLLLDMPVHLGMKRLTAPYIVYCEGNDAKDPGGWTGMVLIAESHMSFHTFVKRKFVTIDIYSCKHFDIDFVVDYIKKFLQTKDLDIYLQDRGVRYPGKNLID